MTTIPRPTLAELTRRAEAELVLTADSDVLRRNLFTPIARALVGAVYGLYGHQAKIEENQFSETCDENALLTVHAPFWLSDGRKLPTAASGRVTITGNANTPIDTDSEFRRTDGMLYSMTAAVKIGSDGTAIGTMVCKTPGQSGNCEPGAKLRFSTPVSGIDSEVTVLTPGLSGGTDIESIEDLRARVCEARRNSEGVGSSDDWQLWAKEVAGVTRAWAVPKLQGLGSVTIFFVRDNDVSIFPDANEVATVQAHLDATGTPMGEIFACGAREKKIDFAIKLSPDTEAVRSTVTAALKLQLEKDASPVLQSNGTTVMPAQSVTIPWSHLSSAVSGASGEYDHKMVAPADDITCEIGELATMGLIKWL